MRHLIAILCLFSLASCTWVKDDNEDCPEGFWLRLSYSYNILDVDAAQKHMTDAYVYVYDAEGKYVKRIYADSQNLMANNHRIRVEGLPEGDYQFVVWSGIGNSPYAVSGDTQTKNDFRLSLASPGGVCSSKLPDIYYGGLATVHYDDAYAMYHVEMMKNTNQLACLVVCVDDNIKLDLDDFHMKVVAVNNVMDASNRLVTSAETAYAPFSQDTLTLKDTDYGDLHGIGFNIMTLRLMDSEDCRLVLDRKSTGKNIFNISLAEYVGQIGKLNTNMGRPLTVQEYLDRQDFYTIVFYLSGDLDRLVQLRVNSWRLRATNHLKL